MAKKPDPVAELSARMLNALQAQRGAGGGGYPTTVARLRELADPDAAPQDAVKAAAKQPFAGATVAAKKKSISAPVVLEGDLDRLAASSLTLEFALETLYASGPPPWPVKKLSAKLEKALRIPFEAAVTRMEAARALPESVAVIRAGRKPPTLYLKRRPPAYIELSERLVRALEARRPLGPGAYPVRLKRLVELTGMAPAVKTLKAARDAEPFAARAVVFVKKHDDSPTALDEDKEEAAGRPGVIDFLLEMKRGDRAQAFAAADLAKALEKWAQKPFADALARRMESGTLPDGLGWIDAAVGSKKHRLLFRVADVRAGRPAVAPPPPAAPPADIDAAFDAAFTRLDRAGGSYNSVSLVDLRRALPFDRAAFDAHLRRLREAHRYGLSAGEGRDGLDPDQRAAGIMEEGTLLLFVSRREP